MRFAPVTVIWLAAMVSPVQAVTMRDDLENELTAPGMDNRYFALASQGRFQSAGAFPFYDALGNLNNLCSGTFINENTVLTAKHCVTPGVITVGSSFVTGSSVLAYERSYTVVGHKTFPSLPGIDDDLALVQVKGKSAPVATSKLYDGPVPVGEFFSVIGYGSQADGRNGERSPKVFGTRLGALNTFDKLSSDGRSIHYDFDSPGSVAAEGLPANFLEGSAMPGDSGGGLFVGEFLVGSVIGGQEGGKYGQKSLAVYLPAYNDWIRSEAFGPVDIAEVIGLTPANPILPTSPVTDFVKAFAVIPEALGLYFFDPPAEEAWEYVVETGSRFNSFLLPVAESITKASISLYDALLGDYRFWKIVELGKEIVFPEGGVDRFVISGLNGDSSDFVYALSFESSTRTTFTQSKYEGSVVEPEPSAVPLPGSLWLSLAGIGALLRLKRKRSDTQPWRSRSLSCPA